MNTTLPGKSCAVASIRVRCVVLLSTVLCGCGLNSTSNSGVNSPLHAAIADNDVERVKQLLKGSPNLEPECAPYQICKPLAFAAARGRLSIVKLLIDAGADPNGRNAYGDTAFIVAENAMATDKATPTEVREIRAYLLHHGADSNQPNAFGITPFMGLCAAGDLELVQLALLKGADVNATFSRTVDSQSGDRNSALMWAASEGQSAVVDVLLQHDADPAHKNTAGETAADWARKNGHVELAEKLANLVHNP